MYILEVYFPNERRPHLLEQVTTGAEALARIPVLLHGHHGCEQVVVFHEGARLFAEDCKGNTLPR